MKIVTVSKNKYGYDITVHGEGRIHFRSELIKVNNLGEKYIRLAIDEDDPENNFIYLTHSNTPNTDAINFKNRGKGAVRSSAYIVYNRQFARKILTDPKGKVHYLFNKIITHNEERFLQFKKVVKL